MTNAYSEKPVLPYKKTSIDMALVVKKIADLGAPTAVKRAVYCIFRFESRNGQAGVCNNYSGMQADSGRWPAAYDQLVAGTCVVAENGTALQRRFLCFASFEDFLTMYADRLMKRGLFVGGKTYLKTQMQVTSEKDLARAYEKDWVKGDAKAEPSAEKMMNFLSMYKQAVGLFP